MISLLTASNPSVMTVLAHPDDEVLLCFGTLALFSSSGIAVHLLFMTDGGQGRAVRTSEVASLISASYKILDYPVSNLNLDLSLVKSIEDELEDIQPAMLITHSYTDFQQQDHIVVSRAATLAGRRNNAVSAILHAEPPSKSDGFAPNFFVKVDRFFDIKVRAMNLYRDVLDRWYMYPEILRSRASWWGIQAENSSTQSLYEAFDLKFFAVR